MTIERARHRIRAAFQRERLAQVIAAIHPAGSGTTTKRPGSSLGNPHDRFIGDLDNALMRLADPKDIVAVTVRMLGAHTGADRCGYAQVEVDQDHFVILGDYARAATTPIAGRYLMSAFVEGGSKALLEHHPFVIDDSGSEPPSGVHIPPHLRSTIRSLVCVPVVEAGHVVAGMAVIDRAPRRWSRHEIHLIETAAHRCWESLEHVAALRRWKASYEDYRSFIAVSSEGIWRFEIEQPIPVTLPVDDQIELLYQFAYLAECNDAMSRMYGYESGDQILGARLGDIVPQSNPKNIEYLRAVHANGYSLNDVESSELDRYGNAKIILNSLNVIVENGMIVRVWGTQRDITAQRKAEEERERLLRQEKEAREEAEAASRMKDEFLATISHELRTPLTAILGWATMLSRGSLPQFQTRHALQVIQQSARSQARLVDDILDTARIITGRLMLDAHPLEIDRVFLAAVDVIRPSAEAKRIVLQAAIDDRSSIVFGDANRVQQVIWNLLSNAVKFTAEGGRVETRLSRSEGQVEITVTDTGMGIDPQFLPYVFDRFRQADSTSTRKHGGLGLGLAIVRHVVEMHGGTVAASSPGQGHGATFKVRFPIASPDITLQPEEPAAEPESKQSTQPGQMDGRQNLRGVRVMVVEDDVNTLEMVRVILQDRGAEVITASSADDALQALDHSRPDALVSDLGMPEHDGYELIEHIRERGPERGGNIPAVALTAYARAEDRVRALTAGFQIYVSKPVDPNELVAVLANLTPARAP